MYFIVNVNITGRCSPLILTKMMHQISTSLYNMNMIIYYSKDKLKPQVFKSKNKRPLTTSLSWHCPFNVIGCKDWLLYAAALHQIIGEHGWAQAILGITGHKQQLHKSMREETREREELQQDVWNFPLKIAAPAMLVCLCNVGCTLYGVRYTVPFLVPLSRSVLQVTSLNDSSTFLHSLKILGKEEAGET